MWMLALYFLHERMHMCCSLPYEAHSSPVRIHFISSGNFGASALDARITPASQGVKLPKFTTPHSQELSLEDTCVSRSALCIQSCCDMIVIQAHPSRYVYNPSILSRLRPAKINCTLGLQESRCGWEEPNRKPLKRRLSDACRNIFARFLSLYQQTIGDKAH